LSLPISVHLWNAFFPAPSLILPSFFHAASASTSIVSWVFLKHLALFWWSRTKKPNQSSILFVFLFWFFFFCKEKSQP